MSGKSIFVLAATLALCACSQSVSVMQLPPVLHPATVTIDFGTSPLWREADTTYNFHLNRLDSITSAVTSDSDFTVLNAPLSIRKQDSTVSLNIRYQPESIANHTGSLLLLAGKDTLGLVSLNGGTSPFERHVGDSYVMASDDSSKTIDSFWIAFSPRYFEGSPSLDQVVYEISEEIVMDGSIGDDWIVHLNLAYSNAGQLVLPFGSLTEKHRNDTNYYRTEMVSYDSKLTGDTSISIGKYWLLGKNAVATYSDTWKGSSLGWQGEAGQVHASYCYNIGFLTSFNHFAVNNHNQTRTENYHLLRFHLRR